MWGNTIAIHNIFKEKKSTITILKKKHKKKKKTILEEKMEKKHAGKVKVEFSTSSILKKKSTKIILKKNMWGNTAVKQTPCGETL